MLTRLSSLALALFLPFAGTASMSAGSRRGVVVQCPESIQVSERASGIDPGWTVLPDEGRNGYSLESVSFYSGSPVGMARLAPDTTRQQAAERVFQWHLSNAEGQGIWVACSYRNTRLLLSRELPRTVSRCRLTEQLLPSGAVLRIKDVICE